MFLSNNPYRVLGILSNTGLKDIQKNLSKLKAFSKIGKEMELDYNLSFLNLAKLDRTDDLLLKSENQLNLDKDKIINSLFWFVNLNPIDSVALANLVKGDISKAIEIWDKSSTSKEVSLKNFSAFNNLSTLLLLNTLDDSKTDTFKKDTDSIKQVSKAIKLKNEFISSPFFKNHCEAISKSTPISSDDAQEFFTNTILDLFNKNFSIKELSDLFEGLDDKLKDTLNSSLTEVPFSNIKSHIENASNLVEKNKKSGIKVGKQLIKDTLKDIKYLKEISSSDDFQFQSISDKLSNQILQCGIVCFNETGDDQEYLSSYEYAFSLAHGEKTKNRAKDCIKHCKEEIESADQNLLVKLIQNFDAQYKKWESDVEKATIARKNYTPSTTIMGPPGASMWGAPKIPGLEVPFGYANDLFKNIIRPYTNLSEKYGEDNELVMAIGTGLIYRIVNCAVAYMNEQINIANNSYRFKTQSGEIIKSLGQIKILLNAIIIIKGEKEAIKYKNETKISLLDNLKVIKENEKNIHVFSSNVSDDLIFGGSKPYSSSSNSSGCYIATMAYGDYNHPQVLKLRRFRDEILHNSLLGRIFIKLYYAVSPKLVKHLQHSYKVNIYIKNLLDKFINQYLK